MSKNTEKDKHYIYLATTIIKYSITIVVLLIASKPFNTLRHNWYLIIGLIELLMVIVLSNIILKIQIFGWLANSILILLFNIQIFFLIFSHSYLILLFLENIDSLNGLSGRAVFYILTAIIVLIISFLPTKKFNIPVWVSISCFVCLLMMNLYCNRVTDGLYSPFLAYKRLYSQYNSEKTIKKKIENLETNIAEFYKDSIPNYRDKDSTLVAQPNVILIFTEGVSQHIVEDERIIMPNVKAYENISLNFINYYNQTAATYRGLSGQLYSGFQFQNYDINKLISLQEIMKNEGYQTIFINAEPNNSLFTKFLKDMRFDNLINTSKYDYSGYSNSLSDKEIYQLLYDTIEERKNDDMPFFCVLYTYGSHVSLDSIDEKYGDGANPELNKFYDADFQFGEFMEKFNKSDCSNDTVIIYTADHCTYYDDAFAKTFPNIQRTGLFCDRIPFFIYYKGIIPETVDAKSKTSVDLAPTVLDYFDITSKNYFLGNSLFNQDNDNSTFFEHYYIGTGGNYYSISNGIITEPDAIESRIITEQLEKYFALKLSN